MYERIEEEKRSGKDERMRRRIVRDEEDGRGWGGRRKKRTEDRWEGWDGRRIEEEKEGKIDQKKSRKRRGILGRKGGEEGEERWEQKRRMRRGVWNINITVLVCSFIH